MLKYKPSYVPLSGSQRADGKATIDSIFMTTEKTFDQTAPSMLLPCRALKAYHTVLITNSKPVRFSPPRAFMPSLEVSAAAVAGTLVHHETDRRLCRCGLASE